MPQSVNLRVEFGDTILSRSDFGREFAHRQSSHFPVSPNDHAEPFAAVTLYYIDKRLV